MDYTLAVDIGGTKIAAGILDEKDNWVSKITHKSDVFTPESMFNSVLASIDEAVNKAGLTTEQIKFCGVTVPGQVDIENGIAIYQNNLPWRNFPIGDLLKGKLPDCQFTFEHDVVAAALGECSMRDASEELFVYITISTGLSASIINKGVPLRGAGFVGEVGFFPIKGQTLERYASGSGMEKELSQDFNLSLAEAMGQWQDGDRELALYFNERAYQIALGVFNITAMLDPHRIVLGGGVINNQKKFFELIKDHYQTLCTHPIQTKWPSRIERSMLKGEAGLFGVGLKAKDR